MNPLAIVLIISLVANALLGYAYLGQRDTAVVATEQTVQATGVAQACSNGVDAISKTADKRRKDAAPKVEAAKQAADTSNKQADQILSTPAAVPGDDCKSAQARVDSWWEQRK